MIINCDNIIIESFSSERYSEVQTYFFNQKLRFSEQKR